MASPASVIKSMLSETASNFEDERGSLESFMENFGFKPMVEALRGDLDRNPKLLILKLIQKGEEYDVQSYSRGTPSEIVLKENLERNESLWYSTADFDFSGRAD